MFSKIFGGKKDDKKKDKKKGKPGKEEQVNSVRGTTSEYEKLLRTLYQAEGAQETDEDTVKSAGIVSNEDGVGQLESSGSLSLSLPEHSNYLDPGNSAVDSGILTDVMSKQGNYGPTGLTCSGRLDRTEKGKASNISMFKEEVYPTSVHGSADMRGKHVVLIRTSGEGRRNAYERYKDIGVYMIMVQEDRANNWASNLNFFDDWIETSTNDIPTVVAKLEELQKAKAFNIDAVFTLDDYGVYSASLIAEHFGCVATPPDVIKKTVDKHKFREWCRLSAMPTPGNSLITSVGEVEEKLKDLTFPLVFKPSQGAGSMFVRLVYDMEGAKHVAEEMMKSMVGTQDFSHWAVYQDVAILVEEYIDGVEVDIDTVVQNGEVKFACVSDNFPIDPPYFLERGGTCPSNLPTRVQQEFIDLVVKWVKTHGPLVNSILHFEAKYSFRLGATAIEVNMRLGGAETHLMVMGAYYVDLAECGLRIALGLPVQTLATPFPKRHLISINFRPLVKGKMVSRGTPKEVLTDPDFIGLKFHWPVGADMDLPPVKFQYVGWMVAKGRSRKDAKKNLDRLAKLADIRIEATSQDGRERAQSCINLEVDEDSEEAKKAKGEEEGEEGEATKGEEAEERTKE